MMIRSIEFFRFLALFLLAFIKANLSVAWLVLFVPNSKLKPALFSYDVSDMTRKEILILSQCITLTPGTITVEVADDNQSLLVHCLDFRKPEETSEGITQTLKKPIKRFMRP